MMESVSPRRILFVVLVAVFFGGNCRAVELRHDATADPPKRIEFSVELASGIAVKNIVYKKDAKLKRELLQFRRINGIQISSDGSEAESRLPIKELAELLEESMATVNRMQSGASIKQIQMDADFVAELWNAIVAAVVAQAGNLSGSVEHKNKEIQKIVMNTIMRSNVMSTICAIAKRYGYDCDRNVLSINPIPFKAEYLHQAWSAIAELPDAGLASERIWFGIRLQRVTD